MGPEGVGARRGGGPQGWGPKSKKSWGLKCWGPEGWGRSGWGGPGEGQNFAFCFFLSRTRRPPGFHKMPREPKRVFCVVSVLETPKPPTQINEIVGRSEQNVENKVGTRRKNAKFWQVWGAGGSR